MRNDTVIAEGPESFAVGITGVVAIAALIEATNVIAIGEIAAETRDNNGAMTSIVFDHSALQGKTVGTVTSTAAVTAAPKFVDPATGNYHEAIGSPTIDAGIDNPFNGATDLEGNTRSLPGHLNCSPPNPPAVVDIGAFELVPVAPPCVPAPASTGSKPAVPGTAIEKARIKGRTAKFRFGATGAPATGFECKLDGKTWRKCSSPSIYRHLAAGRHAFRVRAIGAAGTDATPALREFRIHRPHRHRHRAG
ncbi:MAG: hypothetical protein J0H06_04165 [Actinobacteria bacterium]|nr:hypothetical protein [Actinomycetota bacterium]OJU85559.1 MAG: hypothetical protein BGO11_00185 [Solirubrobacterales bacterium 70-9]